MEAFIKLFGNLTIADVVTVSVALVFMYKIYTTIRDQLESRWKREKDRDYKVQEVIEQAEQYPEWRKQSIDIQEKLFNTIERLATDIKGIAHTIEEDKADVCRYRILRFNDEILHDVKHSKEHFDQVLDDITEYEQYCENHPEYENNKAVLAIENIKRIYQKCSDENTFL